jgi:hypothetical protein
MKKICLFLISFAISVNFFAQVKTYHVNDSIEEIKNNSILYFLPRAVINVTVQTNTSVFIPGPYSRFADKYLTIKNVKHEQKSVTEIEKVEIVVSYEADPNAAFFVKNSNKRFRFGIADNGVIKSYNTSTDNTTNTAQYFQNKFPYISHDQVDFTDLSAVKNFIDKTDTTYRVVEIDSVFQKIPVYNTKIVSKSLEQKAEEAANFILTIRNRRFDQISGYFDIELPSTDLEFMISELNDLENEYLSLFIGKTINYSNSYSFSYIPLSGKSAEKIKLFYLSDTQGILFEDDGLSFPVSLEILNRNNTVELSKFYTNQTQMNKKDKSKGLFYRIPAVADITVSIDDFAYYKISELIPQYGIITYLPSKLFKNKNLQIIFDEKYGSVKTISNE